MLTPSGMLDLSVCVTFDDVFSKLKKVLLEEDLIDEYFSCLADRSCAWNLNEVRWVACYAVTGGSEGHYIHVDLIYQGRCGKKSVGVFLGKTFKGMEHAYLIARRCAELLGA